MKRILLGGSALLALYLLLSIVAGALAAEAALRPGRRVLSPTSSELAQQLADRHHASLQAVSISAADGQVLRGWSIQPQRGNGDAVILLHGHTDNRAGMLGKADLLLHYGYAVLLPDARAHGQSGGEFATYGVLESGDLRRWYDWLQGTQHPHCIDGLGESMGAALLLESLRTTPEFCAVVAESPFASFREASYDRVGQELGVGGQLGRTLLRPVVDVGFLYARWKHGVDFEAASPEQAVAESTVPVLLIHGTADNNLPIRHSWKIVAHAAGRHPAVVFWEVSGARHCGAQGADPAAYEQRVVSWFVSNR